MTRAVSCPLCGCDAGSTATHVIAAALAVGDIDRALDAGLLDDAGCSGCSRACTDARASAREVRLTALSARERYRKRTARLDRRIAERAARRVTAAPRASGDAVSSTTADLPPAAAAALARAKAKVAGRRKP